MVSDGPFYSSTLNADTYDSGVGRGGPETGDDVAFYMDLAAEAGPDVLELASGTGRVSIALAFLGQHVTGLERAPAMVAVAERKRAAADPQTRGRVRFVAGDMADLDLGRTFDLVIIPGRSFAFLLEPAQQRACLDRVVAHLRPGGLFAMQLFDPVLEWCAPGGGRDRSDQRFDPMTGHRIRVDVTGRVNDPLSQVMREAWRFTETDDDGRVLREEEERLALRWTYRHEMRYLLELAGLEVLGEYSDFDRSPPAYGREQVWVARRPG